MFETDIYLFALPIFWSGKLETIGSLVMSISWYWSMINQRGHGRPVRGHYPFSVNVRQVLFMLNKFSVVTFKYLCVSNVFFCPERIFGEPWPPHPHPIDSAFSLLINPKGGLWHSCVFWDHHVSLLNTYLTFLSRTIQKTNHTLSSNNGNCRYFVFVSWILYEI